MVARAEIGWRMQRRDSRFPMDWLNTMQVTVTLTSGHSQILSISRSSQVGDLKTLAQKSFGQFFSTLVTAEARILSNVTQTVKAAGLQDGDQLTAIVGEIKLASTDNAVAAWCFGSDRVVTWGHPDFGGDSSAVQHQLRSVQQVQATDRAFAAIREDGSVVTWGRPLCGGDSSEVQDKLRSVRHLQASKFAFAAILEDGSVATWGDQKNGGDSSAVQEQLRSVRRVQATCGAFAGILEDGSVVAWGYRGHGGNSSAVQHQLRSVQQVQATDRAFAAILEDGSVVAWGNPHVGGDSSAVQDQLRSVRHSSGHIFCICCHPGRRLRCDMG